MLIQRFQLARLLRLQRSVGLFELLVRIREAAIELLQLQTLAMQLDQHRHLATQDLRHDRDRDVIDCAELVALRRSNSVSCTPVMKMIGVRSKRG
jgi:hypothetical protein